MTGSLQIRFLTLSPHELGSIEAVDGFFCLPSLGLYGQFRLVLIRSATPVKPL